MVLKQFTQCEGPRAIMHTNMGDITIQLYPEVAPKTVENFVTLAKRAIIMASSSTASSRIS